MCLPLSCFVSVTSLLLLLRSSSKLVVVVVVLLLPSSSKLLLLYFLGRSFWVLPVSIHFFPLQTCQTCTTRVPPFKDDFFVQKFVLREEMFCHVAKFQTQTGDRRMFEMQQLWNFQLGLGNKMRRRRRTFRTTWHHIHLVINWHWMNQEFACFTWSPCHKQILE